MWVEKHTFEQGQLLICRCSFYLVSSHRQWEHIDQHAHSVHGILRYEDILFHEGAESRGVGGYIRGSLAHGIVGSSVGFA
jgi:hypothetical protein